MSRRCHRSSSGEAGCLIFILLLGLAIFTMPIMGGIILAKGKEDEKSIGAILLVVGVILWIVVGTSD